MVVLIHIVGGDATRAALTLMRVSTPVCSRAAVGWLAAGRFLEWSLGEAITQQTLITVGYIMIVEHFVK